MPKAPSRRCPIVAVDGPAGSGKSSVCSEVAKRLGWTYVNTGFLYRSLALIARQNGQDFQDHQALDAIMQRFCLELHWDQSTQQVFYQGKDLSPLLYTDQAGRDASTVAKDPRVRAGLLPLQRRLTCEAPVGALVDGRDIGTVVFPDADLKIFMTASLEVRAKRRLSQIQKNMPLDPGLLEDLKASILERDQQDAKRGVAPLKQAPDALMFDTSELDLEGSIQGLLQLIQERVAARA